MSGTDVAQASSQDAALAQHGGYGFTAEDVALIAQQVCKPKDRMPTYSELRMFLAQAQATGLNPLARQVYAVFRKVKGQEQMTIQTGIDGFRLVAQRTGQYLGQSGPYWFDTADNEWHEVWLKDYAPAAAKVIVRKAVNGLIAETPAVAHFREYVPMYDGKPSGMWGTMPANQIAKCAEALALRKAFPNDLSGIYTTEEMQQADAPGGSNGAAAADLTARAEAMTARHGAIEGTATETPPTDVPATGPGFDEETAARVDADAAAAHAAVPVQPEGDLGEMADRVRTLLSGSGEDEAMIAARLRGAKTPQSMQALLTYAEGRMAQYAAERTGG
jgi:phage recombination protein Bet